MSLATETAGPVPARAGKPSYCTICHTPTIGVKLCAEHRTWPPARQLAHHLYRARAGGVVDFDDAWDAAVSRVAWPHDTEHRIEWKRILGVLPDERGRFNLTHREIWERAYYRIPPPAHREISVYTLYHAA